MFYDDADDPSVSVPCLDFFGLPHGRPVAYDSAPNTAQEGRGFNSYIPMPFGKRIRIELVNGAAPRESLYTHRAQMDAQRVAEITRHFADPNSKCDHITCFDW